jgi:hypothetical protein
VYGLTDRAGYVVINAAVVDAAHDAAVRPATEPDRETYAAGAGSIVQCAHCRLVQRVAEPSRWDWVSDWVAHSPAGTSHGLCPVCLEYYYPAMAT